MTCSDNSYGFGPLELSAELSAYKDACECGKLTLTSTRLEDDYMSEIKAIDAGEELGLEVLGERKIAKPCAFSGTRAQVDGLLWPADPAAALSHAKSWLANFTLCPGFKASGIELQLLWTHATSTQATTFRSEAPRPSNLCTMSGVCHLDVRDCESRIPLSMTIEADQGQGDPQCPSISQSSAAAARLAGSSVSVHRFINGNPLATSPSLLVDAVRAIDWPGVGARVVRQRETAEASTGVIFMPLLGSDVVWRVVVGLETSNSAHSPQEIETQLPLPRIKAKIQQLFSALVSAELPHLVSQEAVSTKAKKKKPTREPPLRFIDSLVSSFASILESSSDQSRDEINRISGVQEPEEVRAWLSTSLTETARNRAVIPPPRKRARRAPAEGTQAEANCEAVSLAA